MGLCPFPKKLANAVHQGKRHTQKWGTHLKYAWSA